METVVVHKKWFVAIAVGLCLVGVAVVRAQKGPTLQQSSATDARELSSVFREVSAEALPSIVSIETRGKATRVSQNFGVPFDKRSPLNELFKNRPEFRELFRGQPERRMPAQRGSGSGFIIDSSGIIMTNNHVVRGAEEVKVRLHDGREFIARDIKTDPYSDVAIIRIDVPGKLQAIQLGNSDVMQIGDWVLAVGSPFGLDMSVTAGIISAKGRGAGIVSRENFLQTDAAINPGNSGGPLLNLNGEVIGINTAISTRSGGSDGVGFAIPSNMAKWVVSQLIEKGNVSRAYLGVTIQQVDSELAKQFQISVGGGSIVTQVIPKSPAAKAKIEPGDVILEFNGQKVSSPRNLQGIVERLTAGRKYKMTVIRNGKRMNISVVVREMPKDVSQTVLGNDPKLSPLPKKDRFDEIGIEIGELTPEIAEQLGVKDTKGVVITSVEMGSPAYEAGLRSGQIIEKVGVAKVTTPKEFEDAMKSGVPKKGILFLVRSQAGTRFLVIPKNAK